MADDDQCDDNEEVNNFNRFVSRILSGITRTVGESEVCSFSPNSGNYGISPSMAESRDEPIVEMMNGDDSVRVIVELRGASKDDIRVMAKPEEVRVSFSNEVSSYSRTVAMPCLVDTKQSRATFRNGVLEVVLARAHTDEAEAVKIV